MILETERLYFREMKQTDFNSLCKILQDEDTMYAYEGAFNDNEVHEWLDRQISRYKKWNFYYQRYKYCLSKWNALKPASTSQHRIAGNYHNNYCKFYKYILLYSYKPSAVFYEHYIHLFYARPLLKRVLIVTIVPL